MVMMNALIRIFIFISLVCLISANYEDRKVYVVYMGPLPEGDYSPSLHHSRIIKEIVDPSFGSRAHKRSFERSFNGFSAYLTEQEYKKLASYDGVVSVFPSKKLRPQTTRSWDFIGFHRDVIRQHLVECDTIIGVIDTGIWPESESFNDEVFGPIPKKWKGECKGGRNFTCNRKIIGARSYVYNFESKEYSARDDDGHGTHVASIAAGNEVRHASFYGLAHGIARGGIPSARLAIYKACLKDSCFQEDIMSAFEDAIADGVDIISISLGGDYPVEINFDPIAIGAFHAMEKNILTVNVAGNTGKLYSVSGIAPWLFTVAASYTDRRIVDKVILGDGTILQGDTINGFPSSATELPLVYGKQEVTTSSICSEAVARSCLPLCLDSSMIKDKVVICDGTHFLAGTQPGAFGFIIPSDGQNVSHVMPLPIAALTTNDINLVKTYKNSSKNATIKLLKSEEINNPAAHLVAPFSSRGPVILIPDIVKPDITAPGVEILAAYSQMVSPSDKALDERRVKFNIISGTSMACPHVTAAAVFVKSFHPHWSPSAIKSALMTTASQMNVSFLMDAEFAYGSGLIDPVKAMDPGLVYETHKDEYKKIWCNIPTTRDEYLDFANASCPLMLTPRELNYPSMGVLVVAETAFAVSFPRTVTNVGPDNSTYVASIHGDVSEMHITVKPETLQFTALNQKMSFVVTVGGKISSNFTVKSASILWTYANYKVRSPVVVYTLNATSIGEAALRPPPSFCNICVIFLLIMVLLE